MAYAKPESAETAKHILFVDPAEIIVNDTNTRKADKSKVKEYAASFASKASTPGRPCKGQEQAVVARKTDAGLELVFGFTRHAAAVLHNEQNPESPMKLMVEVREMTDEDAYIASVTENFHRSDPSPVEIAAQQKKLLEVFGKSEEEVAAIYGKKGPRGLEWLRSLQKINALPAPVRRALEKAELPLHTAIAMAGLPEVDQEKMLAAADRNENGKVRGESIRNQIKAQKREKGIAVNLSVKQIKEFFASLTGPAEDPAVRKLASKLEAFCGGELSPEATEKAFLSLGGAIEAIPRPKVKSEPKAAEPKKAEKKDKKKGKNKPSPKSKSMKKKSKPTTESELESEHLTEELGPSDDELEPSDAELLEI